MANTQETKLTTNSICAIYFCQQLDKSSLSFASVFGLAADANLVYVLIPLPVQLPC